MKRYIYILVIGITLFMVACGATETSPDSNEEMILIKHELGETEVPKDPKKVVVFDFGILDTLDELGVEVTGLAQANIPPYLEKYGSDDYENIGSLKEPDFEKLSRIDPDLIIISNRQAPLYDELSAIAKTIHLGVDNNRFMESFVENMEIVGDIFGKEAEIEKELASIEESIEGIQNQAAESKEEALIILANDDKISAYGPGSRFGLIHDVFGIKPVDGKIEAATHGMNVTFEYVLDNDPDILYVVDRSAVVAGESSAEMIVENKLMENTKAFKNDRIIYLDPNYWYLSGGGLVSVTKMIEEINDSLDH